MRDKSRTCTREKEREREREIERASELARAKGRCTTERERERDRKSESARAEGRCRRKDGCARKMLGQNFKTLHVFAHIHMHGALMRGDR